MGLLIKIVLGYLGFKLFGILGLIMGLVAGHYFAKGLATQRQRIDPDKRREIETELFNAAFPLMGFLAKSDGRVSEDEISATEELMTRMHLSPEQRQQAILLFKGGAKPEFTPEPLIIHFLKVCGNFGDVRQMLLVYLIAIALADGDLHEQERNALQRVAQQLGSSSFMFEQLLKMAMAQQQFRGGQYQDGQYQGDHSSGGRTGGYQPSSAEVLKNAYQAIGVDENCSDAELKKAYRKLMSQYHPDKLAGQGVPEEMLKVATERSQEIQAAYDVIKKARKR